MAVLAAALGGLGRESMLLSLRVSGREGTGGMGGKAGRTLAASSSNPPRDLDRLLKDREVKPNADFCCGSSCNSFSFSSFFSLSAWSMAYRDSDTLLPRKARYREGFC